MNINEADRDTLRKNQRKIFTNVIGNIVEYKPQDPKNYKPQVFTASSKTSASTPPNHSTIKSGNSKLPILKGPTKKVTTQMSPEPKQTANFDVMKKEIQTTKSEDTLINLITKNSESLPIPIEDVKKNSWLNMDKVEFDKMAWMFTPPKLPSSKNTSRFDKKGYVVSSSQETNLKEKDDTNHIPELSENDGQAFDIGELAMLLDSGYQRQVSYALIVITKMAELVNKGYYDASFDENLLTVIVKYYLLRVRHHMDNKDQTTRFHAFRCMAAILCNTDVDEVYLDRIHPTICDSLELMRLEPVKAYESDDQEEKLNDGQYCEVDPIMCLIKRTNILQRFVYIMGDKEIDLYDDYLECIVDVLIRFTRHSREVAMMLNRKDFLDVLIESCLPASIKMDSDYSMRLSQKSLKLIRIIAQAILESRQKMIQKQDTTCSISQSIIQPLQTYFLIKFDKLEAEDFNNLMPLNIEAMRTIKVLSQLGEFKVPMMDLMILAQSHIFTEIRVLCFLEATNLMTTKISVNWQLAVHLIDLCGYYCKNLHVYYKLGFLSQLLNNYIKNAFCKWLNEIIMENCIPHLDVSLTIVTAMKYLKHSCPEDKEINQLMIDLMCQSRHKRFLRTLFSKAIELSFLTKFPEIDGRARDAENLPSYGILNFNRSSDLKKTINPLLDSYSPHYLIEMFISKLYNEKDITKINFMNEILITRYLKEATTYDHLPVTHERDVKTSFLAQREVKLLSKILLLLNRYQLEYRDEDSCLKIIENVVDYREPEELNMIKTDCYSNICYYAISLLPLLNSNAGINDLKSQILERILLDDKFQYRFIRENSKLRLKSEESDRNLWQKLFVKGKELDNLIYQMDFYKNRILLPLYETLVLRDRYWLLEPIKHYYLSRRLIQKDSNKDGQWFKKNTKWVRATGELLSRTDTQIIGTVLEFHFLLLLYCIQYKKTIVRSNVDDILCILGTIYLHDDIFHDESLNLFLTSNVRLILNDCLVGVNGKFIVPFKIAQTRIDPISLHLGDFFDQICKQYDAVSYGNLGFANYLLLFILPETDVTFRKKLFQEYTDTCLKFMDIQTEELYCPLEMFFTKREKDVEMKMILMSVKRILSTNQFLSNYIEYHSSGDEV